MNSVHVLLFWFFVARAGADSCDDYIMSASGFSLGEINGKCIAITKNSGSVTGSTTCKPVGKTGYSFTRLSIDSVEENNFVKDGLLEADRATAYIGYYNDGTKWSWDNGDLASYSNWKSPPPVVPQTTIKPLRSTLAPSQQRRGTAVVIAVDASLYSTSAFTFAQMDFVKQLAYHIGDRGPAEFAFLAYGCSQITPWVSQYPPFVSNFETTDQMIQNLNETIVHDCVRTNPFDFSTMFKNLEIVYYNRWSGSPRPFKSPYISIIVFGSSTDATAIKTISALSPLDQSSVITVNVGPQSAELSQLSIPYRKNGFRVNSTEDILDLVPKIDTIIFGNGVIAQNSDSIGPSSYEGSIDATTYSSCAFMNSADGYWYPDDTCAKGYSLCQYTLPTPAPPPTVNPTIAWSDPCFGSETGFTYFSSLDNAKCYRTSQDKRQFSEAEDECISDHPVFLHTPKLTSVQTTTEQNMVDTMASKIKDEGMFWIGLRRDPANSSNWYFINGDTYDPSSYNNWRDGYPRDADGCDCVAYVINDKKWINTDCNKNLFAVCAYQFNSSSLASAEQRWKSP